MRILLGIFLLACLTLPFVGTYIWLEQERSEVRHSVFEKLASGLEPKELVTLKFSKAELKELRWEHEREFEYQGQMYDVVEKRIQGDSLIYICWWDHEETHLKEEMKKLLAGPQSDFPQKKDNQQRIETFEKSLYVLQSLLLEKNDLNDLPKKFFPYQNFCYASPYQSPSTPPPDWF